jgi:hypothetical protein
VLLIANPIFCSTCREAPEGSIYEFSVEDLPGYDSRRDPEPHNGGPDLEYHKELIKPAIDAGLLRQDEPLAEEPVGEEGE